LFQSEHWQVVGAALAGRINCLPNSSMGRLYDAVCSLLGLGDYNHFEGECGSLLEARARSAQAKGISPWPLEFTLKDSPSGLLYAAAQPVFAGLLAAMSRNGNQAGNPDDKLIARLALGFHSAVAQMTVRVCEQLSCKTGVRTVALSGGVFQNAVLVELLDAAMTEAGFDLYWNEQVPPNDSGICLGQAWLAEQRP
jgi:hydrogenase maturation protein HypF